MPSATLQPTSKARSPPVSFVHPMFCVHSVVGSSGMKCSIFTDPPCLYGKMWFVMAQFWSGGAKFVDCRFGRCGAARFA